MQIGKEEMKLPLFTDDMIILGENPKESMKKFLKLERDHGKVVGRKG